MILQCLFPLRFICLIFLQSKGPLQALPSKAVQCQQFLVVLTSVHVFRKTIDVTLWASIGQVTSKFLKTVSSVTLLVCEMSAIVRYLEHSLALPFLGIGMKTDLFQPCGHC